MARSRVNARSLIPRALALLLVVWGSSQLLHIYEAVGARRRAVKSAALLAAARRADASRSERLESAGPKVAALVAAGADPNTRDAGGLTPLMHVALAGDVSGCAALLRAGAHVADCDDHGWTAWTYAAFVGNATVEEQLRRAGARTDPRLAEMWDRLRSRLTVTTDADGRIQAPNMPKSWYRVTRMNGRAPNGPVSNLRP